MNFRDQLYRFLLEQTPVRGEYIHIDRTLHEILKHVDYPEPVRALLAEAVTAATLLGATLKFEGSLTLQVQGNGPVNLLVVQVSSARTVRGMAKWQGEIQEAGFRELLADSRLIMTIEPESDQERYQSIIDANADSLARALENYFIQSEQIATRLWLASNGEQAGGLLLQALPEAGSDDEDVWDRAVQLADTVTEQELLTLSPEDLLHRLYHQESVRLFDPEPVSFRCTCSREKITNTLKNLGYDELQDMLRESGEIHVDCSFCNHPYDFDRVDIEKIFAATVSPDIPPLRH